MKRLLLMLSAALLAGCSLETPTVADNPSDPTKDTYAAALNIDLKTFTKTTNGVYYKDLVPGTGPKLVGTPAVQITYAGLLTNGSIFDQATQRVYALSTLVFGMQEGMQGMNTGGERMLVVPSELAYGNSTGLQIPPNSTVLFDVRLDLIP